MRFGPSNREHPPTPSLLVRWPRLGAAVQLRWGLPGWRSPRPKWGVPPCSGCDDGGRGVPAVNCPTRPLLVPGRSRPSIRFHFGYDLSRPQLLGEAALGGAPDSGVDPPQPTVVRLQVVQ